MHKQVFLIAGLLTLGTLSGAELNSGSNAAGAFTRLKTLVGEWTDNTPNGTARLTYELTGGGTALVERDSAGGMPGMMTVYHLDGSRLILTHYCMAGNQPRMQASGINPETGEIQFQFLDITNMANPGAGHMHDVTLRIIDKDHLDAAWRFYENGAPKMTEEFHYTRVR
jgi:hypothetical protein